MVGRRWNMHIICYVWVESCKLFGLWFYSVIWKGYKLNTDHFPFLFIYIYINSKTKHNAPNSLSANFFLIGYKNIGISFRIHLFWGKLQYCFKRLLVLPQKDFVSHKETPWERWTCWWHMSVPCCQRHRRCSSLTNSPTPCVGWLTCLILWKLHTLSQHSERWQKLVEVLVPW